MIERLRSKEEYNRGKAVEAKCICLINEPERSEVVDGMEENMIDICLLGWDKDGEREFLGPRGRERDDIITVHNIFAEYLLKQRTAFKNISRFNAIRKCCLCGLLWLIGRAVNRVLNAVLANRRWCSPRDYAASVSIREGWKVASTVRLLVERNGSFERKVARTMVKGRKRRRRLREAMLGGKRSGPGPQITGWFANHTRHAGNA